MRNGLCQEKRGGVMVEPQKQKSGGRGLPSAKCQVPSCFKNSAPAASLAGAKAHFPPSHQGVPPRHWLPANASREPQAQGFVQRPAAAIQLSAKSATWIGQPVAGEAEQSWPPGAELGVAPDLASRPMGAFGPLMYAERHSLFLNPG